MHQQEKFPYHVSRATIKWLYDNTVQILKLPSRAPDLNPIEKLWGIVARGIYRYIRQCSTLVELREAIIDSWSRIPEGRLQKLPKSMARSFIAVLKSNWATILY